MEHRIENYEELYATFITEANAAHQYLLDTDRIVLECLELNKPIPDDIRQARAKAREAVDYNSGKAADLWDLDNLELFPKWVEQIGKLVSKDERLSYKEKLYKVLQPHTVQADWTPDTAVSLFVEVSIEVWPEIPEVITAESAWMAGQKGTWKGEHYICNMDNCVWNPEQLPSAWDKQ